DPPRPGWRISATACLSTGSSMANRNGLWLDGQLCVGMIGTAIVWWWVRRSGQPFSRHACLLLSQAAEQIMVMPAHTAPRRRWTEEEFYQARDAAPPGERWELVDGEVLVTPSPNWVHQRITLRLAILLDSYVRAQRLGEVFT